MDLLSGPGGSAGGDLPPPLLPQQTTPAKAAAANVPAAFSSAPLAPSLPSSGAAGSATTASKRKIDELGLGDRTFDELEAELEAELGARSAAGPEASDATDEAASQAASQAASDLKSILTPDRGESASKCAKVGSANAERRKVRTAIALASFLFPVWRMHTTHYRHAWVCFCRRGCPSTSSRASRSSRSPTTTCRRRTTPSKSSQGVPQRPRHRSRAPHLPKAPRRPPID